MPSPEREIPDPAPRGGRALPSGTVTFLFTDVEGSTRHLAEAGDEAWATLLADEHRLLLEAVEGEGGVEFGTEGDGHFLAFDSARAAVRAAVAAQRALARHPWPGPPLLVRMGIHTGEARLSAGDYLGLEVHRAARVAAAANGGQVLVSGATEALLGTPGDGIELVDLGEHRLKDLARPERLFQVRAPGLETSFPPLRTLDRTPNNLPAQLTSFVGRAEVARAAALLERTRLLTLTGPGGTGKTRLSLALAANCLERFPGGAWFVPLAPVTDPGLVDSAIAGAMGLLSPSRRPMDQVVEHLRERRALLVLDNFEQILAGAPLVADLLRAAAGLTVIVSSRAPLRITGEQELPVPPLALPPAGAADAATVASSEAVHLFAERAAAVRPDFALTDENASDVAAIVRGLDGLPLAIELAAARTRLLSPAAMAQRLGDRLGLLESGGRDLPARQRTLRGAIAWSHDLLEPADRRLFARLAVFAGGGSLEMAERACVLPGESPPLDVLGGVERLAEHSLLRVEDGARGEPRFGMLETIREFARERLSAAGELEALRDRHADAFLGMVCAAAGVGPGTSDRGAWLDRLEEDHDNLRAALDRLVERGDHEAAAAFIHAAWRFWQMRAHIHEGRSRARAVLEMPGWSAAPSRARLHALEAAGGLAYWAGDMAAAHELYGQAVDQARGLGDEAELAEALYNRFFATRPTSGVDDWIESIAGEGRVHLDEAMAIWSRLGNEEGVGKALWGLAEHHAYRMEHEEVESATARALEIFERSDNRFWIAWTRFTRGLSRAARRDLAGAGGDLAVALRDFQATRDVSGVALLLSAIASVLLLSGREETGYAIGGAGHRAVAETGLHLVGLWSGSMFPIPDPETPDPVLAAAHRRGQAMPREDAVAQAIALADELAAGGHPAPSAGTGTTA